MKVADLFLVQLNINYFRFSLQYCVIVGPIVFVKLPTDNSSDRQPYFSL